MTKRRRSTQFSPSDDLNIWQASTDLFSNALLVLTIFLFLLMMQSFSWIEKNKQLSALIVRQDVLISSNEELQEIIASLNKEKQQLETEKKILEIENEELKSPPVILIEDDPGRAFGSGSASPSSALRQYISRDLVQQLEQYAKKNNLEGYLVQVIGHTDGQIVEGSDNLDRILEKVVSGSSAISALKAGSNADLGLMRALSVVKILEDDEKLKELELQFRAYSAAQLYIDNSGTYAPVIRGDDEQNPKQKERRRIEIRFTPPGQVQR
ncbi:MAG: hypothetical protein AAGC93_09930 [Cyanobacteria bacterium P01_F01_bin.53]